MKTLLTKFKVGSTTNSGNDNVTANLSVVVNDAPENKSFSKYTPSGEVRLHITNPDKLDFFIPTEELYVLFLKKEHPIEEINFDQAGKANATEALRMELDRAKSLLDYSIRLFEQAGIANNTTAAIHNFLISWEPGQGVGNPPQWAYEQALELLDRTYAFVSAKGMANPDNVANSLKVDIKNFRNK